MDKLVFIRYVGKQFDGITLYELFFSPDPDATFAVGESMFDWGASPSNKKPIAFSETISFIGKVEIEESDLVLLVNSHVFSMYDAIDGVVALAWENNAPDGEQRIILKYGMSKDEVYDIFYNREILLSFKEMMGIKKTN